jgi:hypothetical protein
MEDPPVLPEDVAAIIIGVREAHVAKQKANNTIGALCYGLVLLLEQQSIGAELTVGIDGVQYVGSLPQRGRLIDFAKMIFVEQVGCRMFVAVLFRYSQKVCTICKHCFLFDTTHDTTRYLTVSLSCV